ncbi:protein kinase domain-containing protein [Penicillium malachiteum]|uniref:protein kinase domain-containing protein n=1 Tax=Penicillium malachiteum TaxID=1324776 RepID=UPI0025483B10|nr:protein kinase domain-containing protein [Penicillium malachiteum]KAJ5735802.1 protein kinase domain-containing protein [Penicillium malachiteum]
MPPAKDLPVLPELEFKAYCEDSDFQVQCKPEPYNRSQTVIYRIHDKKWWIKITLHGAIPWSSHKIWPRQLKSKRERRNEVQDLVTMIDFQSLVLLDDTVSELILNDPETTDTANLCLKPGVTNQPRVIGDMKYYIREDPLRVRYLLPAQFPSFRAVEISELIQEIEISAGVFRVFHRGDRMPYVLKIIDRPFYDPQDTDVIKQELENLEQFRGARGIVQSVGVAVLTNPYATCQKGSQRPEMVISGILLEFYSGGSLKHVLKEQQFNNISWEDWAIQIGSALDTIHRAGKTHMDLKPSNIVLDKDGNAILIDISGIGGITHGWQAPEIHDEITPFDLPFQTRQLNDIWTYGKILKEIASAAGDCTFARALNMVADHLTEDVTTRWTLSEAISQLRTSRY